MAVGLGAWLVSVAPTAVAAERVVVRAYDHGEFGRVAFEWPAPIQVESRPGPDELTLRFARPFAADLRIAAERLQPYLDAAVPGHAPGEVVLRLRPGTRTQLLTNGDRIVAVDLRRGDPDPPAVRLRAGRHGDSVRLVFDLPFAAGYAVEREGEQVTVRFNLPARIDATAIAGDLAPLIADGRAGADSRASWLILRVPPNAGLRHFALADNRVVVDLRESPAEAADQPAEMAEPPVPVAGPPAGAVAPPAAAAPPARSPAGPPSVAASARAGDGRVELRFEWTLPVAAAVFVRAGHLWTVFALEPADAARAVPAVDAAAAEVLGPGEVMAAEGGLALRFPLRRRAEPTVVRDGGLWRVFLGDPASPPRPLQPRRLADPPRLFFPGAGAVVRLTDPDLGARLHALPLLESGRGHPQARRFVELTLLATAQGIVWQPLADGLLARPVQQGVELGTPRGLRITLPVDERAERTDSGEADPAPAGGAAGPVEPSDGPAAPALEPPGPDPPLGLGAARTPGPPPGGGGPHTIANLIANRTARTATAAETSR